MLTGILNIQFRATNPLSGVAILTFGYTRRVSKRRHSASSRSSCLPIWHLSDAFRVETVRGQRRQSFASDSPGRSFRCQPPESLRQRRAASSRRRERDQPDSERVANQATATQLCPYSHFSFASPDSGCDGCLVRLSVGVENVDDRIDDLDQALTMLPPCQLHPCQWTPGAAGARKPVFSREKHHSHEDGPLAPFPADVAARQSTWQWPSYPIPIPTYRKFLGSSSAAC
jgi:hypothetical protein